jgi:hypothetical protein
VISVVAGVTQAGGGLFVSLTAKRDGDSSDLEQILLPACEHGG